MPTRLSGWIVALALLVAPLLMPQMTGVVPWWDMAPGMAAWIVLGEAAYWAMRLVAPSAPQRLWYWTNGVTVSAAATVALIALGDLQRDPGLSAAMAIALPIAVAWLLFDLLALAFWRLSRSVSPPVFTAGRIVVWTMAMIGAVLLVLLDGSAANEPLRPLELVLAVLPFLAILVTVFFDYPATLDRRRRNQDSDFQELVANAPPPPAMRIMPGLRRR